MTAMDLSAIGVPDGVTLDCFLPRHRDETIPYRDETVLRFRRKRPETFGR
ncbi:MAG: hypothetical protein WBF73_13835 [Bradyrhizobium sp.]|jgi:hypothetical protein